MFALKNKHGYFGGMVYHAECGWHAGFGLELDHKEVIKYYTLGQVGEQKAFLESEYREKGIEIIDLSENTEVF